PFSKHEPCHLETRRKLLNLWIYSVPATAVCKKGRQCIRGAVAVKASLRQMHVLRGRGNSSFRRRCRGERALDQGRLRDAGREEPILFMTGCPDGIFSRHGIGEGGAPATNGNSFRAGRCPRVRTACRVPAV